MNKCEQILGSGRCNAAIGERRRFCDPCKLIRRRAAARRQYLSSFEPWKPYKKSCKRCQVEFVIETSGKANTVYCRVCAPLVKKSWHREYKRKNSGVRKRTGFNSVEIATKCKCPTCDHEHSRPLFLTPEARARVDAGKPFPKRCFNCKGNLGWDGFCNIADAHSVGVNI